jgi:hypothetical protein
MRLPKKAYANGFVHAMLATEPLIGCTADKMFYPAVPAAIVSGQAKSIDVGGNPDTHVKGTEVKGRLQSRSGQNLR